MNFVIEGQIKSGKNNMGITRAGKRYPRAPWAAWRDGVLAQIFQQFAGQRVGHDPAKTMGINVLYWPGDLIRRDVPGMLDALFHCFERAGVVRDDTLFKYVAWTTMSLNRESPRAEITITTLA